MTFERLATCAAAGLAVTCRLYGTELPVWTAAIYERGYPHIASLGG